MIFPPLFPADEYELDAETILAEMVPSGGMSAVDSLARAIGHADEYETDEMGAACSVYPLTDGDRVAFLLAAMADSARWSAYESEMLGRPTRERSYVVGADGWELAPVGSWAYVRSDDRGFWDVIFCDSEAEARSMLAYWVRLNVPTYCDSCETELEREPYYGDDGVVNAYPESGLCDSCAAADDD